MASDICYVCGERNRRGSVCRACCPDGDPRLKPAPRPTPVAPLSPDATGAARDVLEERRRQVSAEGWTPEHDDQHKTGELAKAATCYASVYPLAASYWPWDLKWWKPSDRRRNLVKAAALILAEIERLDRKASEGGSNV